MHAGRIWFAAMVIAALAASPALAQQANSMSFFVTSVGPGKGGNLGGRLGADRHCQMPIKSTGGDGLFYCFAVN